MIIVDDGGLYAAPMVDFAHDDPFKRLVSCYQSACVQTSLVDGRIIMENRHLLSMDEQQVLE